MTSLQLWSDEIEGMRAEARAVVEAGRASLMLDEKPAPGLPVAEVVEFHRASMAKVTFTVPEAEERELAGVRCRVFRPEIPPRAVYLHFHGGGMISGSPELMDIPNRELARRFGLAVVSVDYRKAPEHPWPAGPDDGVAVARWLLEHAAAELGSDRLFLGGESAGAYMAATVALRIRDELHAIDRVDGIELTFGVFDWGGTPSQRGLRAHDGFDVLSPEFVALVAGCYLPGRSADERRAPDVSPAAADLHGLPPCFVAVGTCDHLLDDSLLLAARGAAAGVAVELFVLPEMPHAFQMFDCGITRAWAAARDGWLATRLG